ncbi:MAG TPA: helix-hairpin-helix domain-containing protein [Bacteroidales bacterium]
MTRKQSIKRLMQIPGIGKSIALDLLNIGITSIDDLKGKDPEFLFEQSNRFAGAVQDRCLLYSFRCAVYFAETDEENREPEKLKWWNWKDKNNNPGVYRV